MPPAGFVAVLPPCCHLARTSLCQARLSALAACSSSRWATGRQCFQTFQRHTWPWTGQQNGQARLHHFLAPLPPASSLHSWLAVSPPLVVSRMRNKLDCDYGGQSARTHFAGEQMEAQRGRLLPSGGQAGCPSCWWAAGRTRSPGSDSQAQGSEEAATPPALPRGGQTGEVAEPSLRVLTCFQQETIRQDGSLTIFVKRVLCPDEVGRCAVQHGWPRAPGLGTHCRAQFLSVSPTFVPDHVLLHSQGPRPPAEAVSPGLGIPEGGFLAAGLWCACLCHLLGDWAPYVRCPRSCSGKTNTDGWRAAPAMRFVDDSASEGPRTGQGICVALVCPLWGFRSDLKLPPISESPWVMRFKGSRLFCRGVSFVTRCWWLQGSALSVVVFWGGRAESGGRVPSGGGDDF